VKPRVYLEVTGCRLNACEAEETVRRALNLGAGTVSRPEDADVSLLFTCAVTSRSQARCRRSARKLLRRCPGRVVAAGCSAALFPDDFEGVPERLWKASSPAEALEMVMSGRSGEASGKPGFYQAQSIPGGRTRALLKVQDGCDNGCAYCIVPLARGASRSLDPGTLSSSASELALQGCREIVLTGVDIASWGLDLGGGLDLPILLERLLEVFPGRIRIGSLEPMRLNRGFVRRLSLPGICRHFHIPFQSGSRAILESMGRHGDPNAVLDLLCEFFPGAGIGTDLMTGFPGETASDFEETMILASDDRLSYLHVFPFSPRPGTRAWGMERPAGASDEAAARAAVLRRMSEDRKRRFRMASIGTPAEALVEGRTFRGSRVALTDNYLPLKAPAWAREGQQVRMVVTAENLLWGLR